MYNCPSPTAIEIADCQGRPRVHGKFIFVGDEKFYLRGVTYGTFRPRSSGEEYPDPQTVDADFTEMVANGINTVRTYTPPPLWLLDAAHRHGLYVMIGLPWEQHIAFLEDKERARSIEEHVRTEVRRCSGHAAILCYTIGNEIPASIVRWYGRKSVEKFIERLYRVAKAEDPGGLVTYVNYPSTEYLHLPFVDFLCFNVYLESRERFRSYLARLQNIAGERPLVLAEIGLDSQRNGLEGQAESLEWQISTAFASGCAGTFVFAWTDEWYRGGFDIEDWDFGLTTRSRDPKPALVSVRKAYAEVPFADNLESPRITVVVCSYNGAKVIRDCLEGLSKLVYQNFEIIVVNDGSTDETEAIAREYGERYGFRVISTENRGLSSARNKGLEEATGEIVAYIDDDAYPDPHWLSYLAATFTSTDHAGVGGPNIAPAGDGRIADCVANSPGGPIHVLLSDSEAEHIPGCNSAYRKACLEAIGGWDPQFRTAGDDVDVCWRLQQMGWTIGFHPAATVWHHRRNSVRTYWKQQIGYGRAEALLERKWPEKYNALGHVAWSGRLYGKGLTARLGLKWRSRVYHGIWGSAPYQSIHQQPSSSLWELPLMPEWYLFIGLLSVLFALSLLWRFQLLALPVLILAAGAPLLQAVLSASRASFTSVIRSRRMRAKMCTLTAALHLLQPMARLRGRLLYGLTPWRRRLGPRLSFPWKRNVIVWSEIWHSADEWLQLLESILRADSVVVRGGNYDPWDLEVRGGTLGAARLLMTIEEHGAGRQLIRFRVSPRRSAIRLVLIFLLLAISMLAALGQAWITTGIFAAVALVLIVRKVVERSVAVGTILSGLNVLKTKTEGASTASSKAEEIIAEAQSVLHLVYRSESRGPKADSVYGEAELNVRSALKKATQPSHIEDYLEELQPTIKIKKARA